MNYLILTLYSVAVIILLYKEVCVFVSQYYDIVRFRKWYFERFLNMCFSSRVYVFSVYSSVCIVVEAIVHRCIGYLLLSFMFLGISLVRKVPKNHMTRRKTMLFILTLGTTICLIMLSYLRSKITILIPIIVSCIGLIIFICNLILTPLEFSIRLYYLKAAKRKLKLCENLKIIAITGSYGKTSTKNILGGILKKHFLTRYTKTANTLMGLCKFINDEVTINDEYLILEYGVDKRGGMDKLLQLARPDISIITGVGYMHMTTFKYIENVRDEKLKLLYNTKESGKCFFSQDSEILNDFLKSSGKYIGYSRNDLKKYSLSEKGMSFEYNNQLIKTSLLGLHQLTNVSCVIKVLEYIGIKKEDIIQGLNDIQTIPHRLQKKIIGDKVILDDSYNSNEQGMKEAINVLNSFQGKKAIITPGIIELGSLSYDVNYRIGEYMKDVDIIYLVGLNGRSPLYRGIKSKKLDMERVHFCLKFIDAYNLAMASEASTILIANDLDKTFLQ